MFESEKNDVVGRPDEKLSCRAIGRLLRRLSILRSSKSQITSQQIVQPLGVFKLPVEIRHEIYSYLFNHLKCRKSIFSEAECHDPFQNPGAGLIGANRALLKDVAEFLYQKNPRFSFHRPSLCLLSLSWTESCLYQLKSLEITLPASETMSLEPIFNKIVLHKAPLSSLTLHLVSTFPGRLSYPWPIYIVPRFIHERPAREIMYSVHPRYLAVQTHTEAAVKNIHLSRLSLGNLEHLRYLNIRGQPEFSIEFELAVVKLHLKMLEAAKQQGKELVLSANNGPRGHEWYYEVWIAPSVRKPKTTGT